MATTFSDVGPYKKRAKKAQTSTHAICAYPKFLARGC
jgi:hypothetical protein